MNNGGRCRSKIIESCISCSATWICWNSHLIQVPNGWSFSTLMVQFLGRHDHSPSWMKVFSFRFSLKYRTPTQPCFKPGGFRRMQIVEASDSEAEWVLDWSCDLECRKCGAHIKGCFLQDLRMRSKKCRCLTSTKSNLVWPCVPGLDFKYYLEGNRTTWSNQPSFPTSPLSRIHTCRRKRHQWQSPKRSLDSMKGEGAVLNFGLGISEYLGCWMHLELGNQQLIAFSAQWVELIPFARSLHGPLRQPQRQLPWRTVKAEAWSIEINLSQSQWFHAICNPKQPPQIWNIHHR